MYRFLTSVLNTLPKGLLVIIYATELRLSKRLWRPCGTIVYGYHWVIFLARKSTAFSKTRLLAPHRNSPRHFVVTACLRKFAAFFSTEFFCPQIITDYHRFFLISKDIVIITDFYFWHGNPRLFQRHGWLRIDVITALRGYGLLAQVHGFLFH